MTHASRTRPGLLWVALLGAMAAPAAPAGAQDPGRLFFSAAERAALDAQRAGTGSEAAPGRTTPAESRLVLNGILRRGDAAPVVWVNGRQVPGVDAAAQDRVSVEAPGQSRRARLKPGQSWEPARGAPRDCVRCTEPAGEPMAHAGGEAPAPAP
jgi:hypothetical protein